MTTDNKKHYMNIHILQVLPLSNLNRDDVGSPKTVLYGDATRARLSSQALKRASRIHFETVSVADRTFRSGDSHAQEALQTVDAIATKNGKTLTLEQRKAVLSYLQAEVKKLYAKADKTEEKAKEKTKSSKNKPAKESSEASESESEATPTNTKEDEKGNTMVWLAEEEIRVLAEKCYNAIVAEVASDNNTPGSFIGTTTKSLTIAGFGRMFANAPGVQTDAAVQVAHAFTTHESCIELDYYVAADDLRKKIKGDSGAGFLSIAEYTSGVFYRYFNIDRTQLAVNWADMNAKDAPERLKEWYTSLIMQLPTGKNNATASHGFPVYILAQESSQPLSYATAFEKPVQSANMSGFTEPSVARLEEYMKKSAKVAGSLFGRTCVVSTTDDTSESLDAMLAFLTEWTRS